MKAGTVTSEVAEPYARALLAIAQDSGTLDELNQLTGDLLALMAESDELDQFLSSPLASSDAKKGVLRQVLGEGASATMTNFLLLLVDRGRIALLQPVLEQFRAMVRKANQTVLAEVTSAVDLTDDQKETVRQKVMALTSARQVEIETTLDPDLLGGVIIRVSSQIVDASLRGQLRRIGMQLGSGQ